MKRTLEGLKMPSICSLVSVEDSARFHHLGQSFPQLLLILRQLLELVNISCVHKRKEWSSGLLVACMLKHGFLEEYNGIYKFQCESSKDFVSR